MGVSYTVANSSLRLAAQGHWSWISDPAVSVEPNRYTGEVEFALIRPGWQTERYLSFAEGRTDRPEACLSGRIVAALAERAETALGFLGAIDPELRAAIGRRHLGYLLYDGRDGRVRVALDEYPDEIFLRRIISIAADGAIDIEISEDKWHGGGRRTPFDPRLLPFLTDLASTLRRIMPPVGAEL